MSTTLEGLQNLRKQIAERQHWCKGAFARDLEGNKVHETSPRAVQWCIMGALGVVTKGNHLVYRRCYEVLLSLAQDGLQWTNDAKTTTHQDILDLIDRAIAEVKP